jgi:hypothetical protein
MSRMTFLESVHCIAFETQEPLMEASVSMFSCVASVSVSNRETVSWLAEFA